MKSMGSLWVGFMFGVRGYNEEGNLGADST